MIEKEQKCKVCGSTAAIYLCDTFNGHSATKSIHHYKCSSCGLVFVGNHFEDAELGEAYSGIDTTEYYNEIADENAKKMHYAIKSLRRLTDESAQIIDIGTGDGKFLKLLYEAGFKNVYGHEIPGDDLSGVADIAAGIYQDFDYQSIPSATFDVVTMLDVIEHVRDPRYLLQNCARILKPGGFVYFHTPVVTRTDRLMHNFMNIPALGKISRMWQSGRTSIFHLQNYTAKSLTMLLRECSFDSIDINIKNELSWTVGRYVRIYVLNKLGLPRQLTPVLVPMVYPLIATDFFNANKSIVSARKV